MGISCGHKVKSCGSSLKGESCGHKSCGHFVAMVTQSLVKCTLFGTFIFL